MLHFTVAISLSEKCLIMLNDTKVREVIMIITNGNSLVQSGGNAVNRSSKKLSLLIDNFFILCIYEEDYQSQEGKNIEIDQLKRSLTEIPIFQDIPGTNSFVVWERAYQENTPVFNSLRLVARKRLIWQIAENIVTFLLIKFKKFSPTLSSILNDQQLKKQSIQYINDILQRDTFLMDNDVWENFCEWFRVHLTEWVLEEMTQSLGQNYIARLDKKELNELFFQYISRNLSNNMDFIQRFTAIVNKYTLNWVREVITFLNLEDCSINQVESLLSLKERSLQNNFPEMISNKEAFLNLTVNNCIYVMNNVLYQSVREAFYKLSFTETEESPWPTAFLAKGSIEGVLHIKPFKKDHYTFKKHHTIVKETWEESMTLSDLGADILDALCSLFLSKAKHSEEIIEIQIDDLLAIRGLKPKMGGEGRRGGYEDKQRRQVLQSLSIIQKLWISLDKAVFYEKGKPAETKLEGRAFIFVDENRREYPITKEMFGKTIRYKVDQVFAKYLFGSGRQVALLPLKVLHYDPYRKTIEKRIIRYLSWRWRIQARKGQYLQPNKVETLLEAIGMVLNERTPSRTRERLEKALDTLQEDGLIHSWYYEKWDEIVADQKGWGQIWMNAMIVIQPPEFIKEHYRPINRNSPGQRKVHQQKEITPDCDESLGVNVREVRDRYNLSLTQVAADLEISTSYLSHIERGIKVPSKKIQYKLKQWLQEYNY